MIEEDTGPTRKTVTAVQADRQAEAAERVTRADEEEKVVAGSIHREEVRSFWEDTLQADEYILEILRSGYKLPFKTGCTPRRYKEKNNKSALQNVDFAYEETERWMSVSYTHLTLPTTPYV